MNIEELEKELKALDEQDAVKLKAQEDAAKLPALLREREFRKARLEARDRYTKQELLECDVENVGPCLLHWPDEITYNHFMKQSGAIVGDLSKMRVETVEDLIARCAIFPTGPEMLKELRAKNPLARTAIQGKLFEQMRGKLDEEGKK